MDPLLNHVTVVGVNPGNMFSATGISRRADWFSRVIVNGQILPAITKILLWRNPNSNGTFRSPQRSAQDIVSAALDKDLERGSFLNGSEKGVLAEEAQDPSKRGILWRDTVRYTKLSGDETLLQHRD